MIRLITAGACALLLVGCGKKTEAPPSSPAASATMTDAKTTLTLGKTV
jgi:hypothetical protein